MKTIKLSLDSQFNDYVIDYIDGKLGELEVQVFEEYLEQAKAERLFVRAVNWGKQALDQLPAVKAADNFEEKLARRIARERDYIPVEEECQEEQV